MRQSSGVKLSASKVAKSTKPAAKKSAPPRAAAAQGKSAVRKVPPKARAAKPPAHAVPRRAEEWPRPARSAAALERVGNEASQKVALLAAQAGLDKKATQVEIIDVAGKVDYADFLVLMTGQSDRNVSAIADAVEGLLRKNGIRAMSVEGLPTANWVLIDFVDVVVHVFQQDSRALYDLDGLWMDARRVPVQDSTPS